MCFGASPVLFQAAMNLGQVGRRQIGHRHALTVDHLPQLSGSPRALSRITTVAPHISAGRICSSAGSTLSAENCNTRSCSSSPNRSITA